MNIAVNCRLLQKGKLEGIGWFMYETLKRITRNHPEHQFFFIFDRTYDSSFLFSNNVTPVVLAPPTRHPVLWYLWFEWRIPRALRKVKADLFFSPDGFLSLRTKTPQIPVIHDINFAHRPKDLPFFTRHYYNYFFPRFAKVAKRICTVSQYSKNDINQTYQVDKPLIHVVYNGANSLYVPLSEKLCQQGRNKFAKGHPYFIFIGSIHPRKNLDNLIKAFSRFKTSSNSPVQLVIVGTKMWNQAFSSENPSSGDIKSDIHFLGRLEAEDLRWALGSALALTFVPWFEGFGIPVLEAMYAGVPVLTSTETSLPEVGGNAVLYAQPGNISQIADQMHRLVEDETLRGELIQSGFEQKEKFSWDLTAKKVWTSMETVLAGIKKTNG